ncbi:MAG: hypothetical protein ABIQ12_01725 [Opitutaceae bacterium]
MKTSPYAGKWVDHDHLQQILVDAPKLVTAALAAGSESTCKALPKPHNLTVSEAVDA